MIEKSDGFSQTRLLFPRESWSLKWDTVGLTENPSTKQQQAFLEILFRDWDNQFFRLSKTIYNNIDLITKYFPSTFGRTTPELCFH